MSIKLREPLPLDSIEELRAWIEVFDAQARTKGVKDTDDLRALTDAFMGSLGVTQLIRVKQLVAPRQVSAMKWDEIKMCLLRYLEPKKRLLIAERSAFMAMRQADGETVASYAARLREQAVVCEFQKLKDDNVDPAEQLIKMRLIAGLSSPDIKNKVLERDVTLELTVDQVTEYVQQLLLVSNFAGGGSLTASNSTRAAESTVHHFTPSSKQQTMSSTSNSKPAGSQDPFRFFYYEGESEESKATLRRMVGASARVLVQPSISCAITNPALIERLRAAESWTGSEDWMQENRAMAEKPKRDPFRHFYLPEESEESKQKLQEMIGKTAQQLVQPTPSAIITNPALAAKIEAAEKEQAEKEKQQREKRPGQDEKKPGGASSSG